MASPLPDPSTRPRSKSRSRRRPIPVLLLKTRSQPDDTYEELFNDTATSYNTPSDNDTGPPHDHHTFTPHFIPVLEHTRNIEPLTQLAGMLRSGELKRKYGGMIFTSQRAVEAWADVVREVEGGGDEDDAAGSVAEQQRNVDDDAFSNIDLLTRFPLYVVGPATERALQTLTEESRTRKSGSPSPFTKLNPSIHGADSGNGAALANFILSHYNAVHEEHWFTYYEAPRLPFIPLLGMSSQNYGRKRLEMDDVRLQKKLLVFLVGEVRRDVIPRTLMGESEGRRIGVEEVEVYRTEVMGGFEGEFGRVCEGFDREDRSLDENGGGAGGAPRVVVVFSPQGSDIMLKKTGYLSEQGEVTQKAKKRWWEDGVSNDRGEQDTRWIIVTIGPTTRDYLKEKLGIEPDACAAKPSPEGLKQAIEDFLRGKKIRR